MVWNVKRFYLKYFEIGMYVLKLIGDSKGINFFDDEVVLIVFYFVNMEVNKEFYDSIIVELRILVDIVFIIKYYFNVELDEILINYMRFIIYL